MQIFQSTTISSTNFIFVSSDQSLSSPRERASEPRSTLDQEDQLLDHLPPHPRTSCSANSRSRNRGARRSRRGIPFEDHQAMPFSPSHSTLYQVNILFPFLFNSQTRLNCSAKIFYKSICIQKYLFKIICSNNDKYFPRLSAEPRCHQF